jgi:poly-gamma-glutamate capsule biosynthesis protein CapA/YwtB (metallophosphatase superfamily)
MRTRRIVALGLALVVWGSALAGTGVTSVAFGAESTPVAAIASAPGAPVGSAEVTPTPSTDATLTLLAVGDIMCHAGQLTAARTRGGYGFLEAFSPVQSIISGADLAVGNLETTLSDRSFSGYPAFKSPRQFADAIKWAGFDVLSTANNHTLDGGARGVRYTTSYLDRIGIAHFGSNNPAPIIVEKNGIKIAFASYTYATNGIRSPFRSAVNRLNMARIRADIQAVKPTVDLVVVFVHWGAEYQTSIERTTRSQGRYLIDSGADLVLGSHPHVVRPVEQYKGRYIVYSMGNFLSGQTKSLTDLGTMVTADVIKRDGVTAVSGMKVLPVFRDRTSGAGRRTWRTVLLGRNDRLISRADRTRMASYRTFCKRMFRGYY